VPKKKVLFIDDDKDILSLITFVLGEEDIEVIATDDADIIVELPVIKPDLLLLDEWLGEKKGSTICAEIKKIEETSAIPIVLISAVTNLDKIASECAADAFIEKPFDIEKLVSVVKSFL
jgi:DNA-binding response OmpR family regulator